MTWLKRTLNLFLITKSSSAPKLHHFPYSNTQPSIKAIYQYLEICTIFFNSFILNNFQLRRKNGFTPNFLKNFRQRSLSKSS